MTGFRPSDRAPPPAAARDRGGGCIPDDLDSVATLGQVGSGRWPELTYFVGPSRSCLVRPLFSR